MTMMLRETLMGLARVRREVNDLRREYSNLLAKLPQGYSRGAGTDPFTVDLGRSGFDAAFDDVLVGLGTVANDDPWPTTKPAIDWDEWERTTKARIRSASAACMVTTGPMSSTAQAAPMGTA